MCDVCIGFIYRIQNSELYNLDTGEANTFNGLAGAVFISPGRAENIEYIVTYLDICDKYQYFTVADMGKLRRIGYEKPFTSL